jgi:hypothetical protein
LLFLPPAFAFASSKFPAQGMGFLVTAFLVQPSFNAIIKGAFNPRIPSSPQAGVLVLGLIRGKKVQIVLKCELFQKWKNYSLGSKNYKLNTIQKRSST